MGLVKLFNESMQRRWLADLVFARVGMNKGGKLVKFLSETR